MSVPALPQDENALAPPGSAYVFDWPAIQGRPDSRLEVRYFFGDYRYVAFLIDFNDFWFNGRYQYFKFDGISLDRNDLAELCGQDEADKLRREPGRKLKAYVPSQSTWVALRSLRETHHKQQASAQLSRNVSVADADAPTRPKKAKQQVDNEEAFADDKFPVGYSACRELTVPKEWAREQFKSSEFPVQLKLQVRLNGVLLHEQYDVKVSRDNRNDRASRRYRIALTSTLRELGEIVQASKYITEWQRMSSTLVIISVNNNSVAPPSAKAASASNGVKEESEQDTDQIMDDEAAALALAAEDARTGPSTRARTQQKVQTGYQQLGHPHCFFSMEHMEPVPGLRDSLQSMWMEQQRLLQQHALEIATVEEKQRKMAVEHDGKVSTLQQEHHAQLAKLQARQQADVLKAVQRQYSDSANQRSGIVIDQYRCELHVMHEKHGNQLGKLAGKQEAELQTLLEKQHQEARKLEDRTNRLWMEHQDTLHAAMQRSQDAVCTKVSRHIQQLRTDWQQQQEAEEEDAAATLASLAGGMPRALAADSKPAQVEAPQTSATREAHQESSDDGKHDTETDDDAKQDALKENEHSFREGGQGSQSVVPGSTERLADAAQHNERCCSSPSPVAQRSVPAEEGAEGDAEDAQKARQNGRCSSSPSRTAHTDVTTDVPGSSTCQQAHCNSAPSANGLPVPPLAAAAAAAAAVQQDQHADCISSPRRPHPSTKQPTPAHILEPVRQPTPSSAVTYPMDGSPSLPVDRAASPSVSACQPQTKRSNPQPSCPVPSIRIPLSTYTPYTTPASILSHSSLDAYAPLPQAQPPLAAPWHYHLPASLSSPVMAGFQLPLSKDPNSIRLPSRPNSTPSFAIPPQPTPSSTYIPPSRPDYTTTTTQQQLSRQMNDACPAGQTLHALRPGTADANLSLQPSFDHDIHDHTTSTTTTFLPYTSFSNASVTCIPAPKDLTALPAIPPLKYFTHREPEPLERLASTPCLSCTEPQTSGAESGSRSLPSSPAAWESAMRSTGLHSATIPTSTMHNTTHDSNAHQKSTLHGFTVCGPEALAPGPTEDHSLQNGDAANAANAANRAPQEQSTVPAALSSKKRSWSEADGADLNTEGGDPPVKRPPKLMMKMIHA